MLHPDRRRAVTITPRPVLTALPISMRRAAGFRLQRRTRLRRQALMNGLTVPMDGHGAGSTDIGKGSRGWRVTRSRNRLAVMVVVGAGVAVLVGVFGSWVYAPLLGWDAAAAVFTGWVWAAVGRMDPAATRAHATREDPARGPSDVLVLAAAVASLAAVGAVLVAAASAKGASQGLLAGLAVGSVAISWFTVHTCSP